MVSRSSATLFLARRQRLAFRIGGRSVAPMRRRTATRRRTAARRRTATAVRNSTMFRFVAPPPPLRPPFQRVCRAQRYDTHNNVIWHAQSGQYLYTTRNGFSSSPGRCVAIASGEDGAFDKASVDFDGTMTVEGGADDAQLYAQVVFQVSVFHYLHPASREDWAPYGVNEERRPFRSRESLPNPRNVDALRSASPCRSHSRSLTSISAS